MEDESTFRRARFALMIGVLCVSFPAILVRYAAAPALVIAFWRKTFASLILLGPAAFRARRGLPGRVELRGLLPYVVGTGFLLACHFGAWFVALDLTTVASSVVLVSTSPIWTALMGAVVLKERVSSRGILAIGLSVAGVVFIAWGDWGGGREAVLGDLLSVASAMCAAGYLTMGRHVRHRIHLVHWLLGVYAVSAAFLAAGAALSGDPFRGFDGRTWLMFALLALVPSTLGHNLLNYAVRFMEAYKVNIAVLVEPVVSAILAALLFAEVPGLPFYPGSALILAAVWMELRSPAVLSD